MKNYLCKNLKINGKDFTWGKKTYLMGIINLTPDSFSGDGVYKNENTDISKSIEQALYMIDEGADILDIGGESTRPGHSNISDEEEIDRVIPFLTEIRKKTDIPISIDSSKAKVVEAALNEGANIINDVWGVRKNNPLFRLSAKYNVPIIIMHNKNDKEYFHLMAEIISQLNISIIEARNAGVKEENIIVDPGIGFGKKYEHNLELIKNLDDFKILPYPLLLGPSRKSFIGLTLNLPENERLEGTIATISLGISKGTDIIRVHDVKEMYRVTRICDAICR